MYKSTPSSEFTGLKMCLHFLLDPDQLFRDPLLVYLGMLCNKLFRQQEVNYVLREEGKYRHYYGLWGALHNFPILFSLFILHFKTECCGAHWGRDLVANF